MIQCFLLRYSVMLQCWNTEPEGRPHFSSLKQIMDKLEREHHVSIRLHGLVVFSVKLPEMFMKIMKFFLIC